MTFSEELSVVLNVVLNFVLNVLKEEGGREMRKHIWNYYHKTRIFSCDVYMRCGEI